MSQEHCIIVGTSHASANLSAQLRNGGWEGEITIVGEEQTPPYHRPPLSKDFLTGEKTVEQLLIRPEAFYEKADIKLAFGHRITEINRAKRKLILDDGSELAYDKLALTTGATPRRLPIPGSDLDGVLYLRDLADAQAIQGHITADGSVVIIGGGYIGLEAAASLRKQGMSVTVLEAMPRILQRVTAEEVSAFYTRVHEEEGVTITTNAQVVGIEGNGSVTGVAMTDGSVIPAQMVLVGVGVVPNMDLAEKAGLVVEDGIQVDEFARTSDPNIVAAGDCTWHYNPIYDRWLRLESVQNATEQARTAANTLNGKLEPYSALPWFWSDQYDLKLQIAGLSEGYDRLVVRGSTESGRSFSAFYFHGDKLLAVDAINRPKDYMATRKALAAGKNADPALLGDESVDVADAFTD